MARRDKYADDSTFSTPEHNPALFSSLQGLTENFYKNRKKLHVQQVVDQCSITYFPTNNIMPDSMLAFFEKWA